MTGNIVNRLLPVVMLAGGVGMTLFMAVAFHSAIALVFGGMIILSALSFIVSSRVGKRSTRLVLSVVIAVAAIGMSVVFFVVANHNPSAFIFAAFMLLSTGGALYSGLRDESKR
jgi:hypothetical protein